MTHSPLQTSLLLFTTLGLLACASPTRNVFGASNPPSFDERTSALDALDLNEAPPVTCGVRGLDAEHAGLRATPLLFEGASAEVVSTRNGVIELRVLPSRVVVALDWPTETGEHLFVPGEAVQLTRKTEWDSETETTTDLQVVVGQQAKAVYVSAQRSVEGGSSNIELRVDTPLGALTIGPATCDRRFQDSCEAFREVRHAAILVDGSVVDSDAPLSRGEVTLDWARGSRFGMVEACDGGEASPMEESLSVAYFQPAPPQGAALPEAVRARLAAEPESSE